MASVKNTNALICFHGITAVHVLQIAEFSYFECMNQVSMDVYGRSTTAE